MIKSRVPKSSNVDRKPCSERWGNFLETTEMGLDEPFRIRPEMIFVGDLKDSGRNPGYGSWCYLTFPQQ